MEQLLSWKQLIVFLAIALPGYYVVVLLLFYRYEITRLLRSASNPGKEQDGHTPAKIFRGEKLSDDGILYNAALDLMEDFKIVFRAAKEQQLEKDQVLEALQIRIQKYPLLKGTAFQSAITNYVEQESQTQMGLVFSEVDLHRLWE